MFTLIIAAHVIICALLILLVLVQQGRGGGLIDSFSSAESIFGTKTNTFLVKSTSFLATAFFLTCLSLAFLSLQQGKSLIENYRPEAQAPPAPANTAVTPPVTAPAEAEPAVAGTTDAVTQPPQTSALPEGSRTRTTGVPEDTNT